MSFAFVFVLFCFSRNCLKSDVFATARNCLKGDAFATAGIAKEKHFYYGGKKRKNINKRNEGF